MARGREGHANDWVSFLECNRYIFIIYYSHVTFQTGCNSQIIIQVLLVVLELLA